MVPELVRHRRDGICLDVLHLSPVSLPSLYPASFNSWNGVQVGGGGEETLVPVVATAED